MSESGSTRKTPNFEQVEIAHEDAIADRYNRDYHEPPILQQHHEDFAAFVGKHCQRGDRVLDLGCGPASMWRWWRTHLPEPAALVGIDLSPGMIEEARRLEPAAEFRVGSVFALPFEPQTFDVVIASSMLHHIPDDVLPSALREISRVLTEHGQLVGREPVSEGRLADSPGWQSGAIMAFRHLVCRLTHTREYGEPENGPHHHAYKPRQFVDAVAEVLTPTHLFFRHPFSFYVGRSAHAKVVKLAAWFDKWLGHHGGQEFYYVAQKNFAAASDVAEMVRRELERAPDYDAKEFLALLQSAAALLERELGDTDKRSRR